MTEDELWNAYVSSHTCIMVPLRPVLEHEPQFLCPVGLPFGKRKIVFLLQ